MSTVVNPCKVITGKVVMSYLTVNELKTPLGGGTPKYSVSLIIPKSDTATVEKIRAAIKAAYDEGQSKLKGNSKSVPALDDLKTPLRDGDKERKGDDAYKDSFFVNANSTTKPGVVDADRNPILDSSELYSGNDTQFSRHHSVCVNPLSLCSWIRFFHLFTASRCKRLLLLAPSDCSFMRCDILSIDLHHYIGCPRAFPCT